MLNISLGYVTVTTAGTPVPLANVLTTLNATAQALLQERGNKVHRIEAHPLLANTGKTYVGYATTAAASGGIVMNKTTGVGVLRQIQVPATTGHQDTFVVDGASSSNSIHIKEFAVDADVSGEGFNISVFMI